MARIFDPNTVLEMLKENVIQIQELKTEVLRMIAEDIEPEDLSLLKKGERVVMKKYSWDDDTVEVEITSIRILTNDSLLSDLAPVSLYYHGVGIRKDGTKGVRVYTMRGDPFEMPKQFIRKVEGGAK